MPVISPERMKDRHETILAAATKVFSEKGYEATSISDIARVANVSDGLIYKYFRHKRDLLERVLEAFYERGIAELERAVASATAFEDRLRLLIREHLQRFFVEDTGLCRLFISEVRVASDYRGSAIQMLNRRYTAVLIKIVREGIESGEVMVDTDPRLIRDVLFGAIDHIAWRHINGSRSLDVPILADQLTALVCNGLRRPVRRSRA